MPKLKTDFARATLWNKTLKLTTEGHSVAVVVQLFDFLTEPQKKAVCTQLNLLRSSTEFHQLQHHIATQFQNSDDGISFQDKMRALFLLQALPIWDEMSARRVFSAPPSDILASIRQTIDQPSTQLALMSLGVSTHETPFSAEDNNKLLSAIKLIHQALPHSDVQVT